MTTVVQFMSYDNFTEASAAVGFATVINSLAQQSSVSVALFLGSYMCGFDSIRFSRSTLGLSSRW